MKKKIILIIIIIVFIILNLYTGFLAFLDYLKEQKTIKIESQEDYIVKEIKEHFEIEHDITKVIFQSGLPDGYYLNIYYEKNQVKEMFEDNHEDSEIYNYFKDQKADVSQHLIYLIIELVIEFVIIKLFINKKS